jgi:hypothetical protein
MAAALILVSGCVRAQAQVASPTNQITAGNCVICHNETTVVLAKQIQWEKSKHGSGDAYLRSTTSACAGCHSSEGFTAMLAAGQNFSEVKEGVTNPTGPNCRTCHEIHTTYTERDWARRDEQLVNFATVSKTYDAGEGNLCANCHQPRSAPPAAEGGNITVDSVRWGPHHGVQATSFLGVGGYGVDGNPSVHYSNIKNGCPTCHMVNSRHEMTPDVAACQSCHSELTDFDLGGVQTEIKGRLAQLKGLLEAKGLLKNDLPVPGTYPEARAGALWNYLSVREDASSGVHNPVYLLSLLQNAINALK